MAQELEAAAVALTPAGHAGQPKPVCEDVQVHTAGGLYIITPAKRFRVHSAALRLASPVFSCMLDPTSPFCEGQRLASNTSDSPASITLKEDDPEALEIILNIAHLNGHLIPTTLEPNLLFAVASLCDKYDMARSLRCYSILWTEKLTVEDIREKLAIKWLAAAWALKNEALFKIVTTYLVKYVKYRPKGPPEKGKEQQVGGGEVGEDEEVILIFHDGTELNTDGVPQKVLGT